MNTPWPNAWHGTIVGGCGRWNLALPGRSKLRGRMVSSILGSRDWARRLYTTYLGEKRVKHRPHQSNQNRMMSAGPPKRSLLLTPRIALKCLYTIVTGNEPPPISERLSHRNTDCRRLLPEGIYAGRRALFSDAHSRLEVKPGPYGQTLSSRAGRTTKVVRLRITPNFSYAGETCGRRAETRRADEEAVRRRPLCVWHRNAALRRTMLGEGKERKGKGKPSRQDLYFDMGIRKTHPAERARLANEKARGVTRAAGTVGLP